MAPSAASPGPVCGRQAAHFYGHVRELAVVGAGVHDGRAPHGAGDAAGELVAGKPGRQRRLGHRLVRGPGLGAHEASGQHVHGGEVLGQLHRDAGKTPVGGEHVGAEPQHAPWNAGPLAGVHDRRHFVFGTGKHEPLGRPSNVEGGVGRQRLVSQHALGPDDCPELLFEVLRAHGVSFLYQMVRGSGPNRLWLRHTGRAVFSVCHSDRVTIGDPYRALY